MTDTILPGQIPLLNDNLFHHYYFGHPSVAIDRTFPDEYIEVHSRCILKNSIPAHRLDFYMIFLVTSGEGIHISGSKEYYTRKNMLCFAGPNIIQSWLAEGDKNQGYLLTFSDEFFNAGRTNKQFLSGLPFFQIDGDAAVCVSDVEMTAYTSLFQMIEAEYRSGSRFSNDTLRGYIQALISKARSTQARAGSGERYSSAGVRLVKAFTALYMNDVNTVRNGIGVRLRRVTDYADQLGVSQNHLNDTIREITGQSAGQLMRNQLIKQATMCLKHSSKTISEIAYLLGFEDPSYFSRFYKKQTGKLPSDFR
jgi:AraC family transcriptional activator of pobA